MLALRARLREKTNAVRPHNRAKNKGKTYWQEDQMMIFRSQLWDYTTDPAYSCDDVDFLANLEHDIRLLESELEDIRSGLFAETS